MSVAEASARAEGVRASLAALEDVVGITGSFVCTLDGRLVARQIPALFEDAVLAEAGSRLLRVGETFGAGGDALEAALVRYGEHRLYIKSLNGGMLCIVISGPVNLPALRMAANLVARRIGPAVAHAQAEIPPSETQEPRPIAPPQAEAPPRAEAPPQAEAPPRAEAPPQAEAPPRAEAPSQAEAPPRAAPPGMRRFRPRAAE